MPHHFLYSLFRFWEVLQGDLETFSPGCTIPHLSACLHRRDVQTLLSFFWPFTGLTSASPCSCSGGSPRCECNSASGVSWGWRRGGESPPSYWKGETEPGVWAEGMCVMPLRHHISISVAERLGLCSECVWRAGNICASSLAVVFLCSPGQHCVCASSLLLLWPALCSLLL